MGGGVGLECRGMIARALLVGALAMSGAASAEPILVKDVNVTPTGTGGSTPVVSGGTLFFIGQDEAHGAELWKTDGTEAGTVLASDMVPGPDGSSPLWLMDAGGLLYILTGEWGVALQLWRSDGTPEGTVFLTDLDPGYDGLYYPDYFTAVGHTLFFGALDPSGMQMQLWRTDGTPEGTGIVKTITPVEAQSSLGGFVAAGDLLFFSINDAGHGSELWRSDGTADGTVMIRDVRSGPVGSNASVVGVLNGLVYFSADDGVVGQELWRTDGTAAGTTLVADIQPGAGSSYPYANGPYRSGYPTTIAPAVLNGRLFFVADDGVHGAELWRTDGTAAGTIMLADVYAGSVGAAPMLVSVGHDRVLFQVAIYETWSTDGTPQGTVRLDHLNRLTTGGRMLGAFTEIAGTTFFVARLPYPVRAELWRTDGSEAGTVQIESLVPPLLDVFDTFTVFDGKLFFSARDDAHATELWTTDGTAGGAHLVKDVLLANGSSAPSVLGRVGDAMLFTATTGASAGIWRTDGSSPPTLIANVGAAVYGPPDTSVITMPWGILFNAGELWRTDGTAAGTVLVKDINQGPYSYGVTGSIPHAFVRLDATTVLFTASTGTNGAELWRSDGTAAGTRLVRDIQPGPLGSDPQELTRAGGLVFFSAETSAAGRELWRTDGTAAGTFMLELDPGTINGYPNGSYPSQLTDLDGALLFAAYVSTGGGRELWRSDGTVAGTVRVADIVPGSASSGPWGLVAAGGVVYFQAATAAAGNELWRSDGTEAGTVMVVDLVPGPESSDAAPAIALGATLFFVANDAVHGWELWRTDGTAGGTAMVRDIAPGSAWSSPHDFLAAGDRIAFTADDGVHGDEVWTSDGTTAGTMLVRDWKPGKGGGSRALADFDGTLLVSADDGHAGVELWAVPPCGDGARNPFEECDDGGASADGCCAPNCRAAAVGLACGDDGNGCTDDACDGAGTCAHVANAAPCDDGVFCNGADLCRGGACAVHGGDPCPGPDGDGDCAESCAEATADCTGSDPDGAACTDGVFCNGGDTCRAGACTAHAGDPCPGPDGDADCRESCDEAAGACTAADPPGAPCASGFYCTVGETCDAGVCRGIPRDCSSDGDQCRTGACDESMRRCGGPAKPDGTTCDDDDACTTPDVCVEGACSGLLDPPTCLSAFLCRRGKTAPGSPAFTPIPGVDLDDGIEAATFTARTLETICAPATRGDTVPPAANEALAGYRLVPAAGTPRHVRRRFVATDALGAVEIETVKTERLMVRSAAVVGGGMPPDPGAGPLAGYKCYRVKPRTRATAPSLTVHDALTGVAADVVPQRPRHLCTPIAATGDTPPPPTTGLLCRRAKGPLASAVISLGNAFGTLRGANGKTDELCSPAVLDAS